MFTYVQTEEALLEALSVSTAGKRLAVDTETYSIVAGGSPLDCHTGRISLLIAMLEGRQPIIFDIPVLLNAVDSLKDLTDWLEEADYLLFHNAK